MTDAERTLVDQPPDHTGVQSLIFDLDIRDELDIKIPVPSLGDMQCCNALRHMQRPICSG